MFFPEFFLVDLLVHGAADFAFRSQVRLRPESVRRFNSSLLLSLFLGNILLFARMLMTLFHAVELLFQRAGTIERSGAVVEVINRSWRATWCVY